ISGTSIALASPPPASAPAASAPPQSATPSPSDPASVAPSAPPSSPAAAKPTAAPSAPPSGPVPGATLGAVGIYLFGLPDGVVALTTNHAGQIWFLNGASGELDRYDPASARLSTLELPAVDAYVALRADTRGAIWVGSGSGAVYRIAGGAPVLVATAGVPIIS